MKNYNLFLILMIVISIALILISILSIVVRGFTYSDAGYIAWGTFLLIWFGNEFRRMK